MKKVLVLGGVSFNLMVDVKDFPQPVAQTISTVNSYHETLGSTGAGKAMNLKKLGLDVKLYGNIGKDPYGELILSRFQQESISFYYDISAKGTERHLNFMKKNGERLSIFLKSTPDDIEPNMELIEELIKESDFVFLNIIPYCKNFIPLLKKHNKEVWVDLHDYDGQNEYHQEFIGAADVIQFSSENNPEYRKTMESFLLAGKKLVICTHGSKGSTVLSSNGWLETPALNFPVVDTNGAGDAFFTGILYGHIKGYDLEKSVKLASIIGGLAVTSKELSYENLSEDKVESDYKEFYNPEGPNV